MDNFWHKITQPIIVLAPMAGYTDSAFRSLCHQMGAHIVYSEMISVDALCYENKKTLDMLKHTKKEDIIIFQLFGNDPKKFKKAIQLINTQLKNKKNIGIDINFGCPAHKITKAGSGATLMSNLDLAYKIIKTTCEYSNFPVSIKIRTQVKNITAIDFAHKVKSLPFSAIMIHGRTIQQGFAGNIDTEQIKKITTILTDKIVIANGGIHNYIDANKVLNATQAHGISIARGTWGNPWIFKEIKQQKINNISWHKRKKMVLKHAKLFLKYSDNLIPLRKQLVHYIKSQKNASQIRGQLIKATTLQDIRDALKN